jgi:Flp pilus assembly pilin Flp
MGEGGADMLEYILRLADRLDSQRGQALAEYSLILAFVAMACVMALGLLGLTLAAQIDRIG